MRVMPHAKRRFLYGIYLVRFETILSRSKCPPSGSPRIYVHTPVALELPESQMSQAAIIQR